MKVVIASVKESADDCHKSSTTSSSGGTKRTQNETDDSNIKQITKKKKIKTCNVKTLDVFFSKKIIIQLLCSSCVKKVIH